MSKYLYEARIRMSNGAQEVVRIEASDTYRARSMLESQYGKGCILWILRKN